MPASDRDLADGSLRAEQHGTFEQHRSEVKSHLARAQQQRSLSRRVVRSGRRNLIGLAIATVAVPLLVALVQTWGEVLAPRRKPHLIGGILDERWLTVGGLWALVLALSVAAVLLVRWVRRRELHAFERERAQPGSESCSICGAAASMALGQAAGSCDRCGARLVPHDPPLVTSLASARSAALAEWIHRVRIERRRMVGGRLGVLLSEAATLSSRFGPNLEACARAVGGRYAPVSKDLFDWLDEFWIETIAQDRLKVGSDRGSVSAVVDGFPSLIDVQARQCGDEVESVDERVMIYLAAWRPNVLDGWPPAEAWSAAARALAADLLHSGFVVEHSRAGIVARGVPQLVTAAMRSGDFRFLLSQLIVLRQLAGALALKPPTRLTQLEGFVPVTASDHLLVAINDFFERLFRHRAQKSARSKR